MNDLNDMDSDNYKDFAERAVSLSTHYAIELVKASVNGKDLTSLAQKFDAGAVGLFDKTGQLFFTKLRSQNLPDAFIDDMQNLLICMNSYASASAICRTLIEIERHKNGKTNETNG